MEDRLYLRGRVWWGWLYDLAGKRRDFSTRQRNKATAREVAREYERRAADPNYARADATLTGALQLLLKDREEGTLATPPTCATATLEMYQVKAGTLTRLLETDALGNYVPLPLASLSATVVDDYIARRRKEWALPPRAAKLNERGEVLEPARPGRHIRDATIHKEMVTLSGALRLALRRGLWTGNLDAVMPQAFSPEYKPRERRLSVPELEALLGELTPDRAARVAFIVSTSAEWIATERALDQDISIDLGMVLVRGSKNSNRFRTVPIVSADQHSLLEHAVRHARGAEGRLFNPWGNARRDLAQACERAGIPTCSPNDLRRTCASWLRAAGVRPSDIAPVMGHADSRMVEKVYGRLTPSELGEVLASQMPGKTAAHLQLTAADLQRTGVDRPRSGGWVGLPTGSQLAELSGLKVPGTGIEPVTRGFSVRAVVPPSPRKERQIYHKRGAIAAHLQLRRA